MKRVVVLCPGRGSYNRDTLGTLTDLVSPALDTFDAMRAGLGRPTVRELDAAERHSSRLHVAGENASALTAAASLADLDQLDADKVKVVAVCGNSMGWYTALGFAGALPMHHCAQLVETMGQYQSRNVIGGQIVYPLTNEDWQPAPALLAAVDAAVSAIPDLHWSIHLGGQAVLGGSPDALRVAMSTLPAVQRGAHSFPLKLPLHSAFHTPLMAETASRAANDLAGLDWRSPSLPLIDGEGRSWRPRISAPHDIAAYTLGAQVTQPFDFTTMLATALGQYAPDAVLLPGPGTNLGGAVAQTLIGLGWQGLRSKRDFLERQNADPILISMGRADQRRLAVR